MLCTKRDDVQVQQTGSIISLNRLGQSQTHAVPQNACFSLALHLRATDSRQASLASASSPLDPHAHANTEGNNDAAGCTTAAARAGRTTPTGCSSPSRWCRARRSCPAPAGPGRLSGSCGTKEMTCRCSRQG